MSQNPHKLLRLPEEIHILIFLGLDEDDLDRCYSVCKDFRAVLDTTALRYKRLLNYAGKVDVAPPDGTGLSLSERYDALVHYLKAWREAELTIDESLSNDPNTTLEMRSPCDSPSWTGDAIVVFDELKLLQRIFMPGSTIRRQVERREWVVGPEVFRDMVEFPLLAVDSRHDLAIGLSRKTPNGTGQLRFMKLSDPSVDHPDVCDDAGFWSSEHALQIESFEMHGTLWAACIRLNDWDHKHVIYNWKTGVQRVVMDVDDDRLDFRSHILDDSHILLHCCADYTVLASLDGSKPDRTYKFPTSAFGGHQCLGIHSCIAFADPRRTPNCSFRSDPASTVVAIYLCYYNKDSHLHQPILILVPRQTFLTDRSSDCVEWKDWGSAQCRVLLLHFASSIKTLGSRCAVSFRRFDQEQQSTYVDVFLFDLLLSGGRRERREPDAIFDSYIDASDKMNIPELFEDGVVESTLPFRTMHKRIRYEDDEGNRAPTVILTEDSLTVTRYVEKEGRYRVHSFSI